MKLLNYTNQKLSLFVFALIAAWGIFFFYAMNSEIMDETDDMLQSYRDIFIKKALSEPKLLNSFEDTTFAGYSIRPISDEDARNYKERFYDEEAYFPDEDEHIPVRVYKSVFRASDQRYYELEIRLSTVERDDMIETLSICLFALFVLLSATIIAGNRLILKQSFKPLNKLLKWLDSVAPGKAVPDLNNRTKITEFAQLNEAAYTMSLRNFRAYEQQKQFIENASHELQTPLAIALNKIEMLTQSENISEQQLAEIDSLHKALNKAIKMNKSLLFLSRIENEQFSDKKEINLNRLVRELSADFIEIYADKHLDFILEEKNQCTVRMNEDLANTLTTNLIKNAFMHTSRNGKISVTINTSTLQIENSGDEKLDEKRIFQRFYRSGQTKNDNSTGLGLAIVQSIAVSNRIAFRYEYDGKHRFVLKFVK